MCTVFGLRSWQFLTAGFFFCFKQKTAYEMRISDWSSDVCSSDLLVMLSTASYRFVWATTLLQPDTFVALTRALGWLPAQLGFAAPADAIEIGRASCRERVCQSV